MENKPLASVKETFERALGVIRTRVSLYAAKDQSVPRAASPAPHVHTQVPAAQPASMAIAYSGGLDSSALLHLAHNYAVRHRIRLHAFHVHHGISINADAWQAHCERECALLGIAFDALQISLKDRGRVGIEEAARIGRYAALGKLCRKHEVPLLLTAHQQDDQAETVLLQLLRGAGMAGLSGMETVSDARELLKQPGLLMGRPLLSVSRSSLEEFVAHYGIAYVEDESNADRRYARNALRHHVMPALAECFPGFQQRFVRSARHAQAAQRLLDQLAAQDLSACLEGEGIRIDRLQQLDADRMDNVLRYWLDSRGVRMPATAWLSQMRTQLFNARDDARIRITHADCEIRRHRGRIHITPRIDAGTSNVEPLLFRWDGGAQRHFEAYGGTLHFESTEAGIDPAWLRAQELVIRYRHGGERLKSAANRPTKSLKHHYQELDVPDWERGCLPIVTTASGELLFAAGIGMNWSVGPKVQKHGLRLNWTSDAADSLESVSESIDI